MKSNRQVLGEGVPFERIRRITGYLVGTTDRWNSAKREELADRVNHTTSTVSSLNADNIKSA